MVERLAFNYTLQQNLCSAGVFIPFNPTIITPAIQDAILEGRFEAEEARQIPDIVRHGDRVLEIGAGIGFISTLLSRQPKVAGITAVEANPLLMDYMAELHSVNGVGRVRRINTVLTNGPDSHATFYLREDFWMGSLMREPNPYYDSVEVPTTNLNRLLRQEAITLVICDVEGAESFLFEGADLGGVDRIFIEVHDHVTGLSGVGRVFATMAAKGFIYDPRHSDGSVILFQKVGPEDIVRPYFG